MTIGRALAFAIMISAISAAGTGSALAYILAFVTLILGTLMIRFGWRRGPIG